MKKLILVLSLSVAFLLGCLTTTVVPEKRARASAPTQWEHRCFRGEVANEGYDDATKNILSNVGREGWQLVAIGAGARFCFKRPRR